MKIFSNILWNYILGKHLNYEIWYKKFLFLNLITFLRIFIKIKTIDSTVNLLTFNPNALLPRPFNRTQSLHPKLPSLNRYKQSIWHDLDQLWRLLKMGPFPINFTSLPPFLHKLRVVGATGSRMVSVKTNRNFPFQVCVCVFVWESTSVKNISTSICVGTKSDTATARVCVYVTRGLWASWEKVKSEWERGWAGNDDTRAIK